MRLRALLSALVLGAMLVSCSRTEVPQPRAGSIKDPLARGAITQQIGRVESSPGSAKHWLDLGHLYFAHGYQDEALATYTECGRIAPQMVIAFGMQGVVLAQLGRMNEAAEAMAHARSLDGTVAHLHWLPGLWALRSGDVDTASAMAASSLRVDPSNVEGTRLMAKVFLQSGDAATAVRLLNQVVKKRRGDRSLKAELAMALRAAGQSELAARQLRIAGDVEPLWIDPFSREAGQRRTDLKSWVQRILANTNNNQVMKARKQLEALRPHCQEDRLFAYAEGVVSLGEGKRESAVSIFNDLVDEYPDWPDARISRGKMLCSMISTGSDPVLSVAPEADFLHVLSIDHNNPEAHVQLARLYQTVGRHADAVEFWARSVELNPSSRQYVLRLAAAQLLTGDPASSLAVLDRAIVDFGPEGPNALAVRVRAYIAEGDRDNAENTLTMLRAVAPAYPAMVELHLLLEKMSP